MNRNCDLIMCIVSVLFQLGFFGYYKFMQCGVYLYEYMFKGQVMSLILCIDGLVFSIIVYFILYVDI